MIGDFEKGCRIETFDYWFERILCKAEENFNS